MIPQKSTRSKLDDILYAMPQGVSYHPDASWQRYTSLGAGTAPFRLLEAESVQALTNALRYLRKNCSCRLLPLGGGTNFAGSDLCSDDLLFVKLGRGDEFTGLSFDIAGNIRSGAANSIKNVLDFALRLSRGGASALYGIPGTIGGALRMNAGANGRVISAFLLDFDALDLESGNLFHLPRQAFQWGYRSSTIPENYMIVNARFFLPEVDPAEEEQLLKNELIRRMKGPKGHSAGSIFRNPSQEMPAGKLLEKYGAKQLSEGVFFVSPTHANWVIRKAKADLLSASEAVPPSVSDFKHLLTEMAETVYNNTGVILKPEVRFVEMTAEKNLTEQCIPLKILVLKGGISSEREISLESGANVAKALRAAGHEVREFDIRELKITDEMKHWADLVYPVLHGGFGEDGTLQALLEEHQIPFVGASAAACRTIMDKFASKQLMDANGITNARYRVLDDPRAALPEGFSLPLIVKPNSEGSTIGLTLVEDAADWADALRNALNYDRTVLVEEYIQGREGTVGILAGQALPMVEISYPGKLYDYDAKYTHAQGETFYYCPPRNIDMAAQEEARNAALAFARAVGDVDLLRVDVIVRDSDHKVFVLEGNSMPGCTASSLLPKAAATIGISAPELCSSLAMAAWRRHLESRR